MKRSSSRIPFIPNFYTPSKGRRDAISGAWSGLVWPQGVPGVPREIRVNFFFETKHKVITGNMWFKSWRPRRGIVENSLIGGFDDDSRLTFSYAKKIDGVIGGGTLHFELSADGEQMHGRVVGLSSHTEELFYSEMILLKGKKADLSAHSILRRERPTIFIGHGHSEVWKELNRYLQRMGYRVETFESGARAGRPINEVLASMMAATSFALLILTGEDKTVKGKMRPRLNVVHEAGLFQGKLGMNRAIMLVEKGVEEFSNVSGIHYLAFRKNKISDTFKEIIATLKREFP
jgi:Predicted nucleotide-binding protein containing TIR-like domain